MNTVVGKTMPEEIYRLTPKELDNILAGGYARNFNRLLDMRLIEAGVTKPVGLVEKADDSQLDNIIKQRGNAIREMSDKKFRAQQEAKRKRDERFGELFIFNKNKKGGKS